MDIQERTWQDRSLLSDLQEIKETNKEIGFHSEPEDFGSTSYSDHLAGDAIVYIHQPLNDLLNNHLSIIEFGEEVLSIGLAFIVFEDNREEREKTFFDPNDGYLGFDILLDAQAISESNQVEMQTIVARAILSYLEQLKVADIVHIDTDESLPDLDFDLVQFRSDLGAVFVKEEWLAADELDEIVVSN